MLHPDSLSRTLESQNSSVRLGESTDPMPNIKFRREKMRIEMVSSNNSCEKQARIIPVFSAPIDVNSSAPLLHLATHEQLSNSTSGSQEKRPKLERNYPLNFEDYLRESQTTTGTAALADSKVKRRQLPSPESKVWHDRLIKRQRLRLNISNANSEPFAWEQLTNPPPSVPGMQSFTR